jgi:hypothetical protein
MAPVRLTVLALVACYFTLTAGQTPIGEPQSELSVLSSNTPCRMIPHATTCGLPLYLANFQVGGLGRGSSHPASTPGSGPLYVRCFRAKLGLPGLTLWRDLFLCRVSRVGNHVGYLLRTHMFKSFHFAAALKEPKDSPFVFF